MKNIDPENEKQEDMQIAFYELKVAVLELIEPPAIWAIDKLMKILKWFGVV